MFRSSGSAARAQNLSILTTRPLSIKNEILRNLRPLSVTGYTDQLDEVLARAETLIDLHDLASCSLPRIVLAGSRTQHNSQTCPALRIIQQRNDALG